MVWTGFFSLLRFLILTRMANSISENLKSIGERKDMCCILKAEIPEIIVQPINRKLVGMCMDHTSHKIVKK